ncbi:MAG: ArsR/SmtB family transcription factor [Solirubrobacteraceae bacterium]
MFYVIGADFRHPRLLSSYKSRASALVASATSPATRDRFILPVEPHPIPIDERAIVLCSAAMLTSTTADAREARQPRATAGSAPIGGATVGPAADACCAPSAGLNPALPAQRLATIAKALSEPVRLQIVDLLRRSEVAVCQCELITLFDVKQSLLSHHMRKLIDAGLVSVQRRHKWAYYTISEDVLEELATWLT